MLSEQYLTVSQAAKQLGISERSLHRYHAEGIGPARVKIGGSIRGPIRYRASALVEWLKTNERAQR